MMKKRKFGSGGMPSMKESMESGNRVSRQVGAETKKLMPATRSTRPSVGDAIASGNRMSKENAKDLKAVKKYAKGGKVKRYDDGGGVGEMGRAGLDLEAQARRGETLRELDRMDTSVPKVSAPAKKQSFSEAFAAARKRGDKTFTWNGGSYGTKMKGEDDKPAAAKPVAPKPAPSAVKEDKEIVVTGKRPQKSAEAPARGTPATAKPAAVKPAAAKPGSDVVSRTGVGSAINRGVGAINDQMSTQARNMAKLREKNPDIFTRIGNALSERRKVKADTATAKDAARKDYDAKASKAGIGIMTERAPRALKYAKGGSVTRGDGIAKKGHTKGKMR